MKTNKDIVKDFIKYGYNVNDYNIVKNIVSEKYYDHSPAGARSNTDVINILRIIEKSFDDMHVKIVDLIEEGNKVACIFNFRTTHTKEYMGIKATGKILEWEATEIFKIENGKIVESWGYWPDHEIYKKLSE